MKEKIKKDKKRNDKEPFRNCDWDTPITEPLKKRGIFRKILEGIGMGGLIVGGVGFSGIMFILYIIFVWGTGLSMISYGIYLLANGSILWGLVVLLIGTPIVVGLAEAFFSLWMISLVIGLIIALIRWIF